MVFISYSPERLQNIIGIAASHIINVIPPPSPFPKATHKGVFVLCTFKVSSSNRKHIGDYKKEAQFYWLSDQKYGMHQGSGRSWGVCGLQAAEAGVCCREEGQGTEGQPTSASVSVASPRPLPHGLGFLTHGAGHWYSGLKLSQRLPSLPWSARTLPRVRVSEQDGQGSGHHAHSCPP